MYDKSASPTIETAEICINEWNCSFEGPNPKALSSSIGHTKSCHLRVIPDCQWEFQDPKMEVLYHIRQCFGGISPYIALT